MKNMDPALFAETQARIDRQKRQAIADRVQAAQPVPHLTLTPTVARKEPGPLETVVQREVLAALQAHPRCAWRRRINSGAYKDGARFIRYGFKGCSDIVGQLTTGEFLAVECKRKGEKPTPEQQAFLDEVNKSGGMAFVARGAGDVFVALGPLAA